MSNPIRVYAFRYSYNGWKRVGTAIVDGDRSTVKLSEDGNILAIGEQYDSYIANRAGRVQVFRFKDNNWEQIGDYVFRYRWK